MNARKAQVNERRPEKKGNAKRNNGVTGHDSHGVCTGRGVSSGMPHTEWGAQATRGKKRGGSRGRRAGKEEDVGEVLRQENDGIDNP